jgi:MFS superfamily sulfate permease-like transporter
VSSLVTSALILATALLLAPLFKNLPNAVLGAIVITAVLGLIDVSEIRRYWAWRRTDFMLAMAAMVGVLLTTVLIGMLIAVGLSIAFVLYRASRPHVAALGRVPGHRATFADLSRHPDAHAVPGLLIVRLDAPLYFFNANVAMTQIEGLVEAGEPDVHGVLIDLAATADIDVTTTDMLFGLVRELHGRSIEVLLAQVKGSVRDRMRRTGLMDEVSEDRVYLSVGSAVIDFERRHPGGRAAHPDGVAPPQPAASGPAGGDRLP